MEEVPHATRSSTTRDYKVEPKPPKPTERSMGASRRHVGSSFLVFWNVVGHYGDLFIYTSRMKGATRQQAVARLWSVRSVILLACDPTTHAGLSQLGRLYVWYSMCTVQL